MTGNVCQLYAGLHSSFRCGRGTHPYGGRIRKAVAAWGLLWQPVLDSTGTREFTQWHSHPVWEMIKLWWRRSSCRYSYWSAKETSSWKHLLQVSATACQSTRLPPSTTNLSFTWPSVVNIDFPGSPMQSRTENEHFLDRIRCHGDPYTSSLNE